MINNSNNKGHYGCYDSLSDSISKKELQFFLGAIDQK